MGTYPEFDLTKLHGVCAFSVFSGLLLAIQIHTGFDISETGLASMFFKAFEGVLGPPLPYLDFVFFASMMIIEIVLTMVAIFQIASHRWIGAFVSGAGFFGILSAALGSWSASQHFMIFGVILILAGFVVASIKD